MPPILLLLSRSFTLSLRHTSILIGPVVRTLRTEFLNFSRWLSRFRTHRLTRDHILYTSSTAHISLASASKSIILVSFSAQVHSTAWNVYFSLVLLFRLIRLPYPPVHSMWSRSFTFHLFIFALFSFSTIERSNTQCDRKTFIINFRFICVLVSFLQVFEATVQLGTASAQ